MTVPYSQPGFWHGQVTSLLLAPSASPLPSRALIAGTERFTAEWVGHWHAHRPPGPPRDVQCYFATDAVVTGTGEVWLDDRLVTSQEIMPEYVYRQVLGLPERADALLQAHRMPLRTIDMPCVVMPGGGYVFGHFLIETMLYVVTVQRMLRDSGLECKWLIPSSAAKWHTKMLVDDLGIPTADLVHYDPASERLRLRHAVLPSLVHRDDGFHPVAGGMIEELLERLKSDTVEPRTPRLFLVRKGYYADGSGRFCANEDALVAHACATHGFAAVAPHTMPWRSQVALMRQAEVIVGLFGSALHGSIFSPRDARVGCIGAGNMVQTEIASLRGQQIAYMTEGVDVTDGYKVDEGEFAAFVAAVCA